MIELGPLHMPSLHAFPACLPACAATFVTVWAALAGLAVRFEGARRRCFGPDLGPAVLAQYALGALHVQGALAIGLAFAFRGWLGLDAEAVHALSDVGHGFTLSYFLVDSAIILAFDAKGQGAFLVHHAAALAIGFAMASGAFGLVETSRYIFTVELSNVLISAWDLARRGRRTHLPLARAYAALSPLFAASYVPARTLLLTHATWQLLASMRTRGPRGGVSPPLV